MRNAVLPPVTSSQIYNFGNNEVQMSKLEVSSMDNKVHIYGGSFCLEAKVDSSQPRGGGFAIPDQQYYQPSFQFTFSCSENKAQQSMLLNKKVSVLKELDFGAAPMRKRSIEVISPLPQAGITDLIDTKRALHEWKKNKRRNKAGAREEEEWHHPQVKESANIKEHKVPARRSQKLSDKITYLQKLVSPYGKTDTASVLQEASLYIKLLHQQIQNLCQMLISSSRTTQEFDGRRLDLQSRGLCLIPISVMQKLSKEYCFSTCNPYSINPILSSNV